MKNLIIVAIVILTLAGCGPNTYQSARQDLARQYAELEQIADPSLRQQRFTEIAHHEAMLEARQQAGMAQAMSALHGMLLYQAATQPKTANVYLWGLK